MTKTEQKAIRLTPLTVKLAREPETTTMPYHTKVEYGWRCEATGQIADTIWSDHARWAKEGHSANECRHCSEGNKTIGGMLHDLNEKRRKAKAETRKQTKPQGKTNAYN